MRSLCFLLLTLASEAAASIISTSGAVAVTPPPASVAHDAYGSNQVAQVFLESRGVLASDVTVDNNATGAYDSPLTIANSPGVVLRAGTAYKSYLLNADPLSGTVTLTGGITFDAPILGVAFTSPDGRLDSTDAIFGNAATSYSGTSFRGMGGEVDSFFISADARTLQFAVFSFGAQDQIRIIVADVPEAGTAALSSLAIAALLALRKARDRDTGK